MAKEVKVIYTCNGCKEVIKGRPIEMFLPNQGCGTYSTGPNGWMHHLCSLKCLGELTAWLIEQKDF